MNEITIKSESDVNIHDNIIFINCGYQSENMIPLGQIWFVSEVINLTIEDGRRHVFEIRINDNISIQTDKWFSSNSSNYELYKKIIYSVYNKIQTALIEYHTNSYKIKKPKNLVIQSDEK